MNSILKLKPSEAVLIITNLLVLFYAISSYADQLIIIYVFWGESAVIIFFTFLKMMTVAYNTSQEDGRGENIWRKIYLFTTFLGVPVASVCFFSIAMFLNLTFISMIIKSKTTLEYSEVNELLGLIVFPVFSLFISHGFSFINNFINRREYLRYYGKWGQMDLVKIPFYRIMTFQILGIIGAIISKATGIVTLIPAILLTLSKIVADLYYHRKEHQKSNTSLK